MKLYIESDLAFDAQTAWSIFESKAFEERLEEATDLVCEVLEERTEGDTKVRRLRYRSKKELPKVVAKALGQRTLTYEQQNRFDKASSCLHWEVFLPVMSDRVSAGGTTTITDKAGGSVRVVDGDISVRVRLIGGQIEKAVVKEFERGMVRAVDLARAIHREQSG